MMMVMMLKFVIYLTGSVCVRERGEKKGRKQFVLYQMNEGIATNLVLP